MEWTLVGRNLWQYTRKLSFSSIRVEARRVGEDLEMTVSGGERPHIGTVVLAVPQGEAGQVHVTSSVLNVPGHRDEAICRSLAERAAREYQVTVACLGGFHFDGITREQIQEVLRAAEEMEQMVVLLPLKSRDV